MVETNKAYSDQWPADRIQRLKELWTANELSASLIARELGATRCAVLGKVHRLGLERRKPPTKTAQRAKRARVVRARRKDHRVTSFVAPEAVADLPSLDLTLDEIERGECHYPYGTDAPYFFCGQPVQEGSPYCPLHHRLSFVPYRDVRRDPASRPVTFWQSAL